MKVETEKEGVSVYCLQKNDTHTHKIWKSKEHFILQKTSTGRGGGVVPYSKMESQPSELTGSI